jgi:chemotaxis protein MotA
MTKRASLLGVLIAIGGILAGSMWEGTNPVAFVDIPAFLIIICGTAGATMASTGWQAMRRVPKLYRIAFSSPQLDFQGRRDLLIELTEKARREGLLSLDTSTAEIEDEFTRNGLMMVVDGAEAPQIRSVMESEIEGMLTRHHHATAVFEKAGGFAPTMGILGTVMGLVHVLQHMSKPSTLGPAISSAFIATLLGVGSANVVYLPVASRLKALSEREAELRWMTLEGILAVHAGDNPRVVGSRLDTFMPESSMRLADEPDDQPAQAA